MPGRHVYAARAFVVGMVFASLWFLAFQNFRTAALIIAADLGLVLVWRVWQPADAHGWYHIRRKWLDLLTMGLLLGGVLVFALWVPQPG